jgi:hypothetical protein
MANTAIRTGRFAGHTLVAALMLVAAMALAQDKSAEPPADPEQAAKPKPKPRHPDRVYLKDLEGTWVSRDYIERLRVARAPHATARQATGIAIKIEKEGASYPILITNFQRAVLNAIIDVQPDAKAGSYRLVLAKEDRPGISASETTFLYFRGERSADGTFSSLSIAEPNFAKRRYLTYVRLTDPLDTFVNRAVLAGRYQDAEGNVYEFTEGGDATLPDRSFAYEISLDPGSAPCELIQNHRERNPGGQERIGFEWKAAELRLYNVSGRKPPFKCDSKPFVILTRQ